MYSSGITYIGRATQEYTLPLFFFYFFFCRFLLFFFFSFFPRRCWKSRLIRSESPWQRQTKSTTTLLSAASSWRLSRERTFFPPLLLLLLLWTLPLFLSHPSLLYKERSTYAWSLKRMYTTAASTSSSFPLPSLSLFSFLMMETGVVVQHKSNAGRGKCFLLSLSALSSSFREFFQTYNSTRFSLLIQHASVYQRRYKPT